MGIFHGRDLYSPKWINAEIDDSAGRRWVVPIRHTLGDYFIAEIDRVVYCFELDFRAVKYYRGFGLRTIRFLNYDTSNFRPLRGEELTRLQALLRENRLPPVNGRMYQILHALKFKEQQRERFEPHNIGELIAELDQRKDQRTQAVAEFLRELNVEEIVTPVRGIVEYLDDELRLTRPAFLGNLVSHYQRLDSEHKRITNLPLGPQKPWLKMALVVGLIAAVAAMLYIGYEDGWFDSLVGMADFGQLDASQLMQDMTPEEARAAVDRGEIDIGSLPRELQEIIASVELPTVTPQP